MTLQDAQDLQNEVLVLQHSCPFWMPVTKCIIQFHESIPVANEEIIIPPFKFTVTKSSGNKLEEVMLELIEA